MARSSARTRLLLMDERIYAQESGELQQCAALACHHGPAAADALCSALVPLIDSVDDTSASGDGDEDQDIYHRVASFCEVMREELLDRQGGGDQ